jgi:hypothetical protein
MGDPLKLVGGWLALAVVLVVLVEVVPTSYKPIQWALGLIVLFLVLTNVNAVTRLVDGLTSSLKGG